MEKTYSVKKIMQTLWVSMRQYRGSMVVIFSLIVFANICWVIIPLYYKSFFDVLSQHTLITDRVPQLIHVITIILVFNGIGWLSWRISTYANNLFQPRVVTGGL